MAGTNIGTIYKLCLEIRFSKTAIYLFVIYIFAESVFDLMEEFPIFFSRSKDPPFAAVAAIDLASIRATEASCPPSGFEPSRFGKFLVVCLMLSPLLAGVSHAPKHGPQKAVLIVAPADIRS